MQSISLKTVDTFVKVVTTCGSVVLPVTGFGLMVTPTSTGIACPVNLIVKID